MNNFKTLIISFAMVSLFVYALLSMGYGIQNANNINTTILNDSRMSKFSSLLQGNISDFSDSADAQWNATKEEQGEEQQPAGDLTLGSIFHSISTYGSFVLGMGGSILALGGAIGIDSVMKGLLTAMLLLTLILLGWRLIKAG